jgi:carbon-monoxide dehydrogenase large subunit
VKERLVKTAANLLEASQNDMEVSDGKFYVKGSPNVYITIKDVVRVFYAGVDKLPQGVEPTLDVTYVFRPEKKGMFNTFSHAVHIPVIEFEPETGTCKFLKYLIVEDCGKIVNQDVVDGQLAGGLAQVIGGIFFEEMKYDEDGQLLTGTFAEYLIPTAVDIPTPVIEHTVTPSTFPGGFKGMAESSNVCGYAAIVNAVDDALSHFDKEINYTYLFPERLWRLINSRE